MVDKAINLNNQSCICLKHKDFQRARETAEQALLLIEQPLLKKANQEPERALMKD
jgi:hypothetical protein